MDVPHLLVRAAGRVEIHSCQTDLESRRRSPCSKRGCSTWSGSSTWAIGRRSSNSSSASLRTILAGP